MEIYIYSGFSELPSIDFDCLRIITFIKIHDIPVKITTGGNPGSSPNGFLPYLSIDAKQLIAGYENIVEHFKKSGFGVVSENEDFLSAAYIQYLYKHLYPCYQYILWGDPVNGDASRMLYAKRVPFPFNFTHPAKYTKHTEDLLEIFGNFSIKDKLENHNTAELLINAKVCINMVATKLADANWIFNDKPSEIDCTLYAYLAILQHIGLQNNALRTHIDECPNLVKYTKQIRAKYLKDIKIETKKSSWLDRVKYLFVTRDDGSLSSTTVKVLASVFAVGTMVLFAVTHGLLEFSFDKDDDRSYLEQIDDNSEDYDED